MEPSTVLERALLAAEDRKLAALGEVAMGVYEADPDATRRIFSGFDIDHSELGELSDRAARMFCYMAHQHPLQKVLVTCWCDALLVGLMAAREADRAGANGAGENAS